MKTYKLDGIRFLSQEDLSSNLWENYKDKMSREEFEKYVAQNMVVEEREVKASANVEVTDLTGK